MDYKGFRRRYAQSPETVFVLQRIPGVHVQLHLGWPHAVQEPRAERHRGDHLQRHAATRDSLLPATQPADHRGGHAAARDGGGERLEQAPVREAEDEHVLRCAADSLLVSREDLFSLCSSHRQLYIFLNSCYIIPLSH